MEARWAANIPGQMVAGHKLAPQAVTAVGDGRRALMQWKQQSRAGEYSPSSPHISSFNNYRKNQRVDKKLAGLCHRAKQDFARRARGWQERD